MTYYLVFLFEGRVVDISKFDDEGAQLHILAVYQKASYVYGKKFDDVQLYNEVG